MVISIDLLSLSLGMGLALLLISIIQIVYYARIRRKYKAQAEQIRKNIETLKAQMDAKKGELEKIIKGSKEKK